uniref:EC84 protein n=1 Tax=Colletotrichum higginsianum TaxID=80884 RepID=I2G7G4_9PEZI|nr:EC84 protein [Colletotrichum higginsianum]
MSSRLLVVLWSLYLKNPVGRGVDNEHFEKANKGPRVRGHIPDRVVYLKSPSGLE